jgi:hypothetical protein
VVNFENNYSQYEPLELTKIYEFYIESY